MYFLSVILLKFKFLISCFIFKVEEAASATRNLPKLPVLKERYAYKVEFGAKIVYPICFIIFNIVYWSTYSHRWIHKI